MCHGPNDEMSDERAERENAEIDAMVPRAIERGVTKYREDMEHYWSTGLIDVIGTQLGRGDDISCREARK